MVILSALILAFGTWVSIQLLTPYLATAVALAPVVAYGCWRRQQRAVAVVVLFGASVLLDLASPGATPMYTLVSLVSGCLYLELVESRLSPSGNLANVLGVALWLVLWRTTYLLYLVASSLLLHQNLPQLTVVLETGLNWLVTGLVGWGLIELALGLRRQGKRKPSSRMSAYA